MPSFKHELNANANGPAPIAEISHEVVKRIDSWVRMKAQSNGYSNDSIHAQFSDSVTSTGAVTLRIGSSSSAAVILQAGDAGPQPQGWGWADNGWNAPGANIFFAASGTHTIRIQQREDGAYVDQIVLSPDTWVSASPGARGNDTKIFSSEQWIGRKRRRRDVQRSGSQ